MYIEINENKKINLNELQWYFSHDILWLDVRFKSFENQRKYFFFSTEVLLNLLV